MNERVGKKNYKRILIQTFQQPLIVSIMLIAGCSNSLLTKFQDKQCVGNCEGAPEEQEFFNQPVFQTVQMFLAESLVILAVLANKWMVQRRGNSVGNENGEGVYEPIGEGDDDDDAGRTSSVSGGVSEKLTGQRIFLLSLPATCDICGTTLMNVGLLLVPVSIYQMVRGSIVLFVGSFSVIFLKRRLTRKQWTGLLSVTAGVFLVGLSAVGGASGSDEGGQTSSISWESVFGVLVIMLAQVFTASQFVLEEFILEKYSMEPIKVVTWEGAFGTLITIFASLFVYVFFATTTSSPFNILEGTKQVVSTPRLLASSVVIMISLASFNVTGLTVTRLISATSRSTVDTSRTVGIWVVSLLIGWETFQFLQLVGFALLVYGTLLFNGIIQSDEETKRAAEELLPNEFEHT